MKCKHCQITIDQGHRYGEYVICNECFSIDQSIIQGLQEVIEQAEVHRKPETSTQSAPTPASRTIHLNMKLLQMYNKQEASMILVETIKLFQNRIQELTQSLEGETNDDIKAELNKRTANLIQRLNKLKIINVLNNGFNYLLHIYELRSTNMIFYAFSINKSMCVSDTVIHY